MNPTRNGSRISSDSNIRVCSEGAMGGPGSLRDQTLFGIFEIFYPRCAIEAALQSFTPAVEKETLNLNNLKKYCEIQLQSQAFLIQTTHI